MGIKDRKSKIGTTSPKQKVNTFSSNQPEKNVLKKRNTVEKEARKKKEPGVESPGLDA